MSSSSLLSKEEKKNILYSHTNGSIVIIKELLSCIEYARIFFYKKYPNTLAIP